jgi:hypothetical protein
LQSTYPAHLPLAAAALRTMAFLLDTSTSFNLFQQLPLLTCIAVLSGLQYVTTTTLWPLDHPWPSARLW